MHQKSLVLIIHDDSEMIKRMTQALHNRYGQSRVEIYYAHDYKKARSFIKRYNPNMIFLKVELQSENGIEFLKQFQPLGFDVVLLSESNGYALEAFKLDAVDYVMEPFVPEDFNETFNRVEDKKRDQLMKEGYHRMMQTVSPPKYKKFCVSTRQGNEYLNQEEMLYVEADGSYSVLYMLDRKRVMSKKLKEVQEKLDPNRFVRTHNSWIVNLEYVKMYYTRDNQLLMTTGKLIPVSRRNREALLKSMEEFYG